MNFSTIIILFAALAATSKSAAARKHNKKSKSEKGPGDNNLQGLYKAVDVEDGSFLSLTITGPEQGGRYKVDIQDSAWGLCTNDGVSSDTNPFDLGILFGEGRINDDDVLVIVTPKLYCGVKSGNADKIVDFATFFGGPLDWKFTIKDGYLEDNFGYTTIDGFDVKKFGGDKFFKVSVF